MGIVATIANHKGGVGKTSLVVNLADAYSRLGLSVLVVDMDAQANTTKTLLGSEYYPPETSVMDAIFHDGTDISRYIQQRTTIKGVHLIGGTIKLMRIEERLRATTLAPARVFVNKMNYLRELYDLVLVDTPPNLFLMPAIALTCSDYFFVPIQSGDSYSLDGMDDLMGLVKQVREMNPALKFGGAVLNRHDGRRRVDKGTQIAASDLFQEKLLETKIPDATSIKTAAAESSTVMAKDRDGGAALAVAALARETATIMGLALEEIKVA